MRCSVGSPNDSSRVATRWAAPSKYAPTTLVRRCVVIVAVAAESVADTVFQRHRLAVRAAV